MEELATFKTPSEAITFMKQRLLLAGVLITLWKHTSALTASLGMAANLLLILTQELCLRRAHNEVWTGVTFLEKRVSDLDDRSQIEVTKIDLLKTFHEVSVATMIGGTALTKPMMA
jgi:hypothetical protein